MSMRGAATDMNISTPAGCREEALRQGRLANEARGDRVKAAKHIERARELVVLAMKLEADEAKEQA